MSRLKVAARPLIQYSRPLASRRCLSNGPARLASASPPTETGVTAPIEPPVAAPSAADRDPNTVMPEFEKALIHSGIVPIGSRRRRVAKRTTDSLPFEQLPYQAFQEARKILAADRADKVAKIKAELDKIALLEQRDPSEFKGGQRTKDDRIAGLRQEVARLKILADVNDPLVKKRFEDGLGDMSKPIYRYYAEKKWRSYDHRLITQRISQFKIVPDILPKLEPSADVQLFFYKLKVAPGQIIDSLVSENPPRLRVQVFDKGERLVTLVVVDADVPDVARNGFIKRCHFLAVNIPLSPTITSLPLRRIEAGITGGDVALKWRPPFSHKGAPYHRLGIFLLEQKPGMSLDVQKLRSLYSRRDHFSLKSLRDKFSLVPFGFTMFRSVWDENTMAVMKRLNPAANPVEYRRKRIHSLKPRTKPRGWEAKRQGPKFRHLWKYTKRIRGLSNARRWTRPGR